MKMNELILADCFEIFPELKENSFDIVFTDPDNSVCEDDELFKKFFSESKRILKPFGKLILWAPYCLLDRFLRFAVESDFDISKIIIPLDKRKIEFSEGYKNRLPACILIFCMGFAPGQRTFEFCGIQEEEKTHSIQKPIAPCLIAVNELEGNILDPFAGTGIIPAAAKKLERSFLGIEKNPDMFTIAEKRLKERRQCLDYPLATMTS